MNLKREFNPIRDWAAQRGIFEKGDIKTQTIKLGEEFGELCQAVLQNKKADIKDAIGDMVVVLTSVARMKGLYIEDCINSAYTEIKNRKGKIVNNNFVKTKS